MAKDKLTDYSPTAASNTDIGGININEGMLPSNVNNALREQMSHLADFAAGTTGIDVLNLQDDDASHSIKIQAPASVTTTTTFTLPDGDGSANQSLVTNGSGTLSFSTRLANVVEDTTPQLGGNLDTNGNNINFGDNDKATFGDAVGGDLQIYHDGSNSYISDQGTGNLRILAEDFRVVNAANSETMIQANVGSDVRLYYDSSVKLATSATGVDVQGSITADGLTVDGDAVFSNGDASVVNGDDFAKIKFNSSDGSSNSSGTLSEIANVATNTFDGSATRHKLVVRTNDGFAATGTNKDRISVDYSGDISFYDSTGVTQGFFWDADQQRLGLGTSSPDNPLHVVGDSTFEHRTNVEFKIQDATDTGGGTRLSSYWKASGSDVEIGNVEIDLTDGTTGSEDSNIIFKTIGAGTLAEAMRIDSSGNLLVGKTSLGNNIEGFEATPAGYISAVRDGNIAAYLQRKTSDGDIVEFRKDGTTVGSIGVNTDRIYLVNANEGIAIDDSLNEIFPCTSTGGTLDATIGLGNTGRRFKDAHFSGTVNANAFVGDGSGLTGLSGSAVGLTDVGSFILARANTASAINAGGTLSGSSLVYANASGQTYASGSVGVGTWRVHGYVNTTNNQQLTTVWQRIS